MRFITCFTFGFLLFLTSLYINYCSNYLEINHVQENWQQYQEKFLLEGWFNIQQKFLSLEKKAYTVLNKLAKNTNIKQSIKKYSIAISQEEKTKQKTAIFQQLFQNNKQNQIWDHGIAVFSGNANNSNNNNDFLLAWKNWSANVPSNIIKEALQGTQTSYITHSQEKIYTILCCFRPIFNDNDKCIATIVVSTWLNSRYPLSSRYVKKQMFAEEDLQSKFIQEISLHFDNKVEVFANKSQQPIYNSNLEHVAWVTLIPKSKEIVVQNLNKRFHNNQNSILGCFLCILLFLGLYHIAFLQYSSFYKCIFSIILIWIVRYVFFALGFPLELFKLLNFPTELHPDSAMIFASEIYYFGARIEWSGTPVDFLLSNLALFSSCRIIQEYCKEKCQFNFGMLVKIILFFVFCFIFAYSYNWLYVATKSLVQDASVRFVINNEILPSLSQLILMLAIIFLGLALVLVNSILIRYFLPLYEGWDKYYLFIPLPIIACYLVFYTPGNVHFLSYLISSCVCFCIAVMFLAFDLPKTKTIKRTISLFFICLTIYPLTYYESKAKIRDNISGKQEELTEETEDYKNKDFMEQILSQQMSFNKELIESIEKYNDNAAFLLWANNTVLNNYFSNIYISLYLKLSQPLPLNLDPNKFFYWKNNQLYYHLSHFSSGLTVENWFESLIKQHLPNNKLFALPGIQGYSNSLHEKNVLYSLGGKPVYKGRKIIGYVAILTTYQKLHTFAFSQQSVSNNLLRAYFRKNKLVETSIPYMSKIFSPPKIVIEKVGKQNRNVWLTQNIENVPHDCFYFPHKIQHPYYENITDKVPKYQEEIVIGLIGYPIPSLTFMIFYFLQFFFAGLLFVIFPNFLCNMLYNIFYEHKKKANKPILSSNSLFRRRVTKRQLIIPEKPKKKNFVKKIFHFFYINKFASVFSFEGKLLICFFTISGIPVLLLGILAKEHATEQIHANYRHSITQNLNSAYARMEKEQLFNPFAKKELVYSKGKKFAHHWRKENKQILSIYQENNMYLSNGKEFFQTEILDSKLAGKIYYNLAILKRSIFIDMQDNGFIVGYKIIEDWNTRYILSITMVYQKDRIKWEINTVLINIITIYCICLLMIVVVAFVLIYHITKPLKKLILGINKVSSGDLEVEIPRTSNDEIGHLITAFNDMTTDLKTSRKKLIQAEKNAAWTEMAKQIAHEIKNPLTPMKLSAQHILRAYKDNAKQFPLILDKGMTNIVEAIDSLAETATSFSEFAKFTKPNLDVCNLVELLTICTQLFNEYEQENIIITLNIQKNIPDVFIDSHQVKRVFINIITNAIHAFEEKNQGQINVNCSISSNKYILVQIEDNGCGVPEAIKERLFEPNFSTKSYGSGLGLAISKRSIENMNGTISIESKEGIGTKVFVQLPIAKSIL